MFLQELFQNRLQALLLLVSSLFFCKHIENIASMFFAQTLFPIVWLNICYSFGSFVGVNFN